MTPIGTVSKTLKRAALFFEFGSPMHSTLGLNVRQLTGGIMRFTRKKL
jgi:hypothetical protein